MSSTNTTPTDSNGGSSSVSSTMSQKTVPIIVIPSVRSNAAHTLGRQLRVVVGAMGMSLMLLIIITRPILYDSASTFVPDQRQWGEKGAPPPPPAAAALSDTPQQISFVPPNVSEVVPTVVLKSSDVTQTTLLSTRPTTTVTRQSEVRTAPTTTAARPHATSSSSVPPPSPLPSSTTGAKKKKKKKPIRPPQEPPTASFNPRYGDATNYSYMAAALGVPWPPTGEGGGGAGGGGGGERWDPKEHGGRPKPYYLPSDMFMDHPRLAEWGPQPIEEEVMLVPFNKTLDALGMAAAKRSPQQCKWRDPSRYVARYTKTSWERTPLEKEEAGKISHTYGVLATPGFINSRLLPQLNTSLVNAARVDVFIRKTAISHLFVNYIRKHIAATHPRPWSVRVIELYGLNNKDIGAHSRGYHIRNAWMDLEVLRFWRLEMTAEEDFINSNERMKATDTILEHRKAATAHIGIPNYISGLSASDKEEGDDRLQQPILHTTPWYCIIDDDGYVLLEGAQALLHDTLATKRAELKQMDNRSYVDPPLLIGYQMGSYLSGRSITLGGNGFHFNRVALLRLTTELMATCEKRFAFDAGDITASYCLVEGGASLIHTRHVFHSIVPEAIDLDSQSQSPFPAAFHRYTRALLMYRLKEVEDLRRARSELVTWDDVIFNMHPEGTEKLQSRFEKCFPNAAAQRIVSNVPVRRNSDGSPRATLNEEARDSLYLVELP